MHQNLLTVKHFCCNIITGETPKHFLKGGERVNDEKKDWRLSISLTKEQEEAIVKLRQTDEYARCSLGEVVRQLINAGLEAKQE